MARLPSKKSMQANNQCRIGFLCFAALSLAVGYTLPYRPAVILGPSMQPALRPRQMVLVDRRCARTTPVCRGDIVLFHHGTDVYVKRVLGVAGDRVEIVQYSNGFEGLLGDGLPPHKVRELAVRKPEFAKIRAIRVPKGTVYVVGDNRLCSVDSREFGPVPVRDVIGRVIHTEEAFHEVAHTARKYASAILPHSRTSEVS